MGLDRQLGLIRDTGPNSRVGLLVVSQRPLDRFPKIEPQLGGPRHWWGVVPGSTRPSGCRWDDRRTATSSRTNWRRQRTIVMEVGDNWAETHHDIQPISVAGEPWEITIPGPSRLPPPPCRLRAWLLAHAHGQKQGDRLETPSTPRTAGRWAHEAPRVSCGHPPGPSSPHGRGRRRQAAVTKATGMSTMSVSPTPRSANNTGQRQPAAKVCHTACSLIRVGSGAP